MEIKAVIQGIVKRTQAYNCVECGKCSSVCPISLLHEVCLPRSTVRKALFESPEVLFKDELLWSCLNCGLCYERCEFDVPFHEFIRELRIEAYKIGQQGVLAHNGALQAMMKMTAVPELKQNRLNWITKDLKVKIAQKQPNQPTNSIIYFVGCLPYFDAFFTNLELHSLDIAQSTVKILNHLGIEPILMPDERCCGHDLLWTGDMESFKKLAQLNIEAIKSTEAKKIVTSCPECYYMLKEEYPKYFGKLGAEVIHISQLLAEKLPELENQTGGTGFQPVTGLLKVTYQDPCRLGRYSGIYEEPRNVIKALEGIELREMERNRKSAICCGTSGWMTCGTYSKQIQIARLKEAKKTRADLLLTACPKCMIHFKCAQADENISKKVKINIQDITTLIANQLTAKSEDKNVK